MTSTNPLIKRHTSPATSNFKMDTFNEGQELMISPYIARWSGEQPHTTGLLVRNSRLGYRDEQLGDRDGCGALWVRCPTAPGDGQIQFGRVHPRRQRDAMWNMRCQVCGRDPDEDDRGLLWLESKAPDEIAAAHGVGAPVLTCYPPICSPCLRASTAQCPDLRKRATVLRVQAVRLYGVIGPHYTPTSDGRLVIGTSEPSPEEKTFCYHDPRLPMVLAFQQLIQLEDFTIVTGTNQIGGKTRWATPADV
ncbi:hypothetical protein [Streptomyces natalensis]|uniref:hypothetical protein n=1 Tax=Streptomyces natalensis TaxID=68242 RepID=UPI0012FF175F|nr:hypothetical protein [Streptomyces natalensis]